MYNNYYIIIIHTIIITDTHSMNEVLKMRLFIIKKKNNWEFKKFIGIVVTYLGLIMQG